MLNFRQYTDMTECYIGNNVTLSTNNVSNIFNNMRNLINVQFNHPNIVDMTRTYYNCRNLTGSPVCGNNVIDMTWAYHDCYNLTGSPVCGNNVINMSNTYYYCCNLTGSPVCGNNVTNMSYTYYNCNKLNACTVNWYAANINNVKNCFYGKNNSRRYNIHVPTGSTTFNTMIINNKYSLVGANIIWTNNGSCWYNKVYNIYIYPDL